MEFKLKSTVSTSGNRDKLISVCSTGVSWTQTEDCKNLVNKSSTAFSFRLIGKLCPVEEVPLSSQLRLNPLTVKRLS